MHKSVLIFGLTVIIVTLVWTTEARPKPVKLERHDIDIGLVEDSHIIVRRAMGNVLSHVDVAGKNGKGGGGCGSGDDGKKDKEEKNQDDEEEQDNGGKNGKNRKRNKGKKGNKNENSQERRR